MADTFQLTTHELWIDGRSISISVEKIDSTTLRLTWNLPVPITAYNGGLVLLSEQKFTSLEFPEDGRRYAASTNWAAPADYIGEAHVVASFYGFFNDDITQTSVIVSNVEPDKLYYASFHAASNVLQYYTIGSQSYPLESSRFEKQSATYAGSIPSSAVPPENPSNGKTYFDVSTGSVLIWNDTMGGWIKSNQATVPIGATPFIEKNMLFFNTGESKLKYFDGTAWVDCDSTNTLVKMGGAWAPFAGINHSNVYPVSPITGEFIFIAPKAVVSSPSVPQLKFYSLGAWFAPTPDLVQVFDPVSSTWSKIVISNENYGAYNPPIPAVGDFFYNTSLTDLVAWNGSTWVKIDTDGEGAPTTDKMGVGTDGSYDERLRLIKILKHQMGWPAVCVELSEEQFNVAIDNALDEFRRRADNAYLHRHISFTLKPGQSTYYLNDPRDKTDKIVNIIKIHRINTLGISSLSSENGIYAQAFFNQLYQGSNVDILSIHLMNQLSETYEKIFAGNLVFTWDEATRQLMILRKVAVEERVVLEVVMERTEQELLLDRWPKQWLQAWAESEAMEMLGQIRTKFGNLPGANGGLTLNGETLLSMANEKQTELLRQITDYEVGNGGINFGNTAFMIG